MWVGDIISSHSSYLYKCGVLDVICLLPGFTTTSLGINEIGSTLEPDNILYLSDYQITIVR